MEMAARLQAEEEAAQPPRGEAALWLQFEEERLARLDESNKKSVKVTFPSSAPLGIGLKQKDGHVFLSSVEAHSPARGKVNIGAIVKEINGKSVEGKSKDEVLVAVVDAKSARGPIVATFETPGVA